MTSRRTVLLWAPTSFASAAVRARRQGKTQVDASCASAGWQSRVAVVGARQVDCRLDCGARASTLFFRRWSLRLAIALSFGSVAACGDTRHQERRAEDACVGVWEVANRRQWAEMQVMTTIQDLKRPAEPAPAAIAEGDLRALSDRDTIDWLALPFEEKVRRMEDKLSGEQLVFSLSADGVARATSTLPGSRSSEQRLCWTRGANGDIWISQEPLVAGDGANGALRQTMVWKVDGDEVRIVAPAAYAGLTLRRERRRRRCRSRKAVPLNCRPAAKELEHFYRSADLSWRAL